MVSSINFIILFLIRKICLFIKDDNINRYWLKIRIPVLIICTYTFVHHFLWILNFCKASWLRDAPTGLTFNNFTLCPHYIYVFCIYLRRNSDLCHLRHKLVFITEMESVYSAVRTGSLNKVVCASSLKG
jgi:hypothetical protein